MRIDLADSTATLVFMAHLSGACRSFISTKLRLRLRISLLWTFLLAGAAFAGEPDFLHAALNKFIPEVPKNWAYTLTTEGKDRKTTERFDPSRPSTEQWTLLSLDGHSPTAGDLEKYFKYKASQTPGAMQATFHKSDIEPGTVKLIREDADHAEFVCGFREQSAQGDRMLGHLHLLLTVNKREQYVEKFSLNLNAPYSPILTVKMNELLVAMNFTPPKDLLPSLPSQSSSHFAGRIFFIPVEENLNYTYFDFTPSP